LIGDGDVAVVEAETEPPEHRHDALEKVAAALLRPSRRVSAPTMRPAQPRTPRPSRAQLA
jgi:hypothetical protein